MKKPDERGICALLEYQANGPVTPGCAMDELWLDSLEFLEMVVALEKEYDIKLTAEEAVTCETVGDLIAIVESKCA